MSRPSQVVRCSALASVTVGTSLSADATIEKRSDSTPDLVVGEVEDAPAAQRREGRRVLDDDAPTKRSTRP